MGKLLVFEGIDGSGKSTQIEMLSNFLKSQKQKVFVTREPGGTEFGEKCRKFVFDGKIGWFNRGMFSFRVEE